MLVFLHSKHLSKNREDGVCETNNLLCASCTPMCVKRTFLCVWCTLRFRACSMSAEAFSIESINATLVPIYFITGSISMFSLLFIFSATYGKLNQSKTGLFKPILPAKYEMSTLNSANSFSLCAASRGSSTRRLHSTQDCTAISHTVTRTMRQHECSLHCSSFTISIVL